MPGSGGGHPIAVSELLVNGRSAALHVVVFRMGAAPSAMGSSPGTMMAPERRKARRLGSPSARHGHCSDRRTRKGGPVRMGSGGSQPQLASANMTQIRCPRQRANASPRSAGSPGLRGPRRGRGGRRRRAGRLGRASGLCRLGRGHRGEVPRRRGRRRRVVERHAHVPGHLRATLRRGGSRSRRPGDPVLPTVANRHVKPGARVVRPAARGAQSSLHTDWCACAS
jgi:hypothetical protein